MIIPDPDTLHAAGLNTIQQARILVHIGRCGITGITMPALSDAMGIHYNTARSVVYGLEKMKLVTQFTRLHCSGAPHLWVCTKHGWKVLTTPIELKLFPDALTPLKL